MGSHPSHYITTAPLRRFSVQQTTDSKKPRLTAKQRKELRRRSLQIDMDLREDGLKLCSTLKILLLGPKSAGTSTMLKQMRLNYGKGIAQDELVAARGQVYTVTVHTMIQLLEAMIRSNTYFSDTDRNDDLDTLWDAKYSFDVIRFLTRAVAGALLNLWADAAVQNFYFKYSTEYENSNYYFLQNLGRISAVNYVPTLEDVLNLKSQSNGLVELQFSVRETSLRVVDVEGQMSRRQKWIHCFEGVDALIFVASLADYDRPCSVIDENPAKPRSKLEESLTLFGSFCQSKWFQKRTSLILLLNKLDVFAEKLKRVPLSDFFPDFEGGADREAALEYIQDSFVKENETNEHTKGVFVHTTCAVDVDQMKDVLGKCVEGLILKNALVSSTPA